MIEHDNALLYSCFLSKLRVISSSNAKDPIRAYCWMLFEGLGSSKTSWRWNSRLQISQKHDCQHVPKQRSLHHWAQIQLLHVTDTPKAPQFSVQRCWSSWLQATAASKGSAELDQCRWGPRSKINKLFPCSLVPLVCFRSYDSRPRARPAHCIWKIACFRPGVEICTCGMDELQPTVPAHRCICSDAFLFVSSEFAIYFDQFFMY